MMGLAFLALGFFGVEGGEVPYGIAEKRWPAEWGNHRVRLVVEQPAEAVWAHIPWRRRDPAPADKEVLVVEARTGQPVANVVRVAINREFGDLVFQARTAGEYDVYYLPYTENPVNWQFTTTYTAPQSKAEPTWLERNGLTPERLREGKWRDLPSAQVVEFQTWSEFHRFDPMEVIATAAETAALLAQHPDRSYLLFPEDRRYPIRMTEDLPQRWIRQGPRPEFSGTAQPGEFYVFQIGLYAARKEVEGLRVEFSDLRSGQGSVIPARAFRAFNLGGTDWLGRPLQKAVRVPRGQVQALWFGVQVPPEAAPGTYRGTLTVRPDGAEETPVRLSLTVAGAVLEDGGVSDLQRLARLKWLDSTLGLDDEVTPPYTPVQVQGRQVRCLGRSVTFGDTGLPTSIRSGEREILARPMAFVVETAAGPVAWSGKGAEVRSLAPGAAAVEARSEGGLFSLHCRAKMEFDGYLNYGITLTARQATEVQDLRLEIPFRREVATYMMGLARQGGLRPKEWQWQWDVRRANNMVWIGDVDAGLQCKLKGPKETWDIADLSAGGIPPSWGNQGRGGCTVTEAGETVFVRAYTGPRTWSAGEAVEFRFGLLITPVKPLSKDHWNQRYYHFYAPVVPVEEVAATGANIINCHQGNELNPYINYPFLTTEALAAYVKQAHDRGLKVKIYYTVRELSNYVAELWPLRSLGFEVFLDGGGGGHSWLQEHLVSHYAPAWHQPYPNGEVDAALATTGLSRWHNYYLEGLNWLVRHVGIDGLYLDGIGYDREIMKRVRKVLDRARPGCLIDFHSGNEFPFGDLRISPANKYMEHFPYLDSLWFGEGYDYNAPPDYWLVEISGLPFGLFGEMLQGGGNPWRGMLYGMTNRLGWGGDPRPLWRVWDDFGIQDSRMIGYWDPACPVRTNHPQVLATVYLREKRALVSLASWAKGPEQVRLTLDWKVLGLDPQKAHLFAPEVAGFQGPALFAPTDAIPVPPGRGWLLLLDEQEHEVPPAVTADVYRGRPLLLEERFDRDQLGEPWQVRLSSQPGTALKLEDHTLSIQAAANVFALAERPLPPGTALVECRVYAGTDQGATWGPGMALVWPEGSFRINLRPPEGRYGAYHGNEYWFGGFVMPEAWHHLRLRVEADEVVAEASADGKLWYPIQARPRHAFPGDPVAVRLGKMGSPDEAQDFSDPGPPGACAIADLRAFGRPQG